MADRSYQQGTVVQPDSPLMQAWNKYRETLPANMSNWLKDKIWIGFADGYLTVDPDGAKSREKKQS